MQDCQCVERMKKLSEYKQDIEKNELAPDMLLYQPKTSVCDWNENTWSRRLANSLKLTHGYENTRFTASSGFSDLQCELSKREACGDAFIVHGTPDILLKKDTHISTSTVITDSSSNHEDESCPLELCLQRHPLKTNVMYTPEKLGELIACSYILLVCKLIRRISNEKPVNEPAVVKGLLIDKIVGAIHCEVIGKVSQPNEDSRIQVNIYDACGRQLDPPTLCYHLELLNTSYSPFHQ